MITGTSTRQSAGTRAACARPVVISSDRAYAGAALTCLTSLYLNTPTLAFDTCWYTSAGASGADTPEVRAAIDRLAQAFGRRIDLVTIADRRFETFVRPRLRYLGTVTYQWLLIPDLLEAASCLYLDCDIIVQADVEPLLTLPLGDWLVAGTSDGTDDWLDLERHRLGLPDGDTPLNAGVMVLNTEAWRREATLDRMLAWYAANAQRVELADQDLINGALAGRKHVLEPHWNVLLHTFSQNKCASFDADGFRGIFHFNGPTKPWLDTTPAPIRALYEKYAAISPMRMPRG
jgi:lipopolysaccharide biosynthesis glycosyltransferase